MIDQLYADYAPRLTRMLKQVFGEGPPDPHDITQLAFQKLLERNKQEQIRNHEAFLWQTARNLVLSHKRSEGVQARYEIDVEERFFSGGGAILDPQRVLLAREQLRHINFVLHKMPLKRRRAFILHRIEGLNVSEVARRLNLSRSGAQKHLSKAFAQLDHQLRHFSDLEDNE